MHERIDPTVLHKFKDFEWVMETFFTIQAKSGQLVPFKLNDAQKHIHKKIEEQKKATGKVRAIILKARQMGASTYISNRNMWQVIQGHCNAFILTHDREATKGLFNMYQRARINFPAGFCPEPKHSSQYELQFDTLSSSIKTGTARSPDVGRGSTIRSLHLSECAFYDDPKRISTGLIQAVPRDDNTEIVIESTAKGYNYFHDQWQLAIRGESEFIPIFTPWFLMSEYQVHNTDFSPNVEENDLAKIYKLKPSQLAWRRIKIAEFGGGVQGESQFRVEYPSCPKDAFDTSLTNQFIPTNAVLFASKSKMNSDQPLVVAIDVARFGDDKTVILKRRARVVTDIKKYNGLDNVQVAALVRSVIEKDKPARVFIDDIGVGGGVVDILRHQGFADIVEGVNVARSSSDPDKWRNLRAELWARVKEWIQDPLGVSIPDDEQLVTELTSVGYDIDFNGRLLIESKKDLKKRGMPSPDIADALCLSLMASGVIERSDMSKIGVYVPIEPGLLM